MNQQNRKPRHIIEAEKLERSAIKALKKVFEDDKISDSDLMKQIGVFTEKLCFAMYSRKKRTIVNNKGSVRLIIDILHVEGVMDVDHKSIIEEMSALKKNELRQYQYFNRNQIETYQSRCLIIVDWYEKKSRKKLRGLNFRNYFEKFRGTPEMTLNDLKNQGAITSETFKQSMADPNIMDFKPEKKVDSIGQPIYMSLLVDASQSMQDAQKDVVFAHKLALKRLRNSSYSRSNQLHLSQYLFNHKSMTLNALTLVKPDGEDRIVELNTSNYSPISTTALFDSLYEAISKIHIEVNAVKRLGKHPTVMICVMTDGDDNESYKYKPIDIKKLMQKLKDDDLHHSSTLIGWINPGLDQTKLDELGESLGFSSVRSLQGIDKNAISEAFEIWTQV